MKISKRYFSGFCFENEKELFKDYLVENDFTISAFSYGCIEAFEEIYNSKNRVDRIQFFSPAFFQNRDEKFKRMQLMFFKKDCKSYCENFLKGVSYPNEKIDLEKYFKIGKYEQLEKLLNYKWDENKLNQLIQRGIKIEVYLGEEDKIIDALEAKEFFKNFSMTYYLKKRGHIL